MNSGDQTKKREKKRAPKESTCAGSQRMLYGSMGGATGGHPASKGQGRQGAHFCRYSTAPTYFWVKLTPLFSLSLSLSI